MNYILDTNIPILMVKNTKFSHYFAEKFSRDASNTFSVCFVSLGEIDSIIKQNQWGGKKAQQIIDILNKLIVIELDNKDFIHNYGTLDAYSQGKLKTKPLPMGMTARNMGKNDLWIASVALTLQATLITTDQDFAHLDGVFFPVHYIDVQLFK